MEQEITELQENNDENEEGDARVPQPDIILMEKIMKGNNTLKQKPEHIQISLNPSRESIVNLPPHLNLTNQEILRRKKVMMSLVDTGLLYLPSLPMFIFSFYKGGKGERKFSFFWLLVGCMGHVLKLATSNQNQKSIRWTGLFVSPMYLLFSHGPTYSFLWFFVSVIIIRSFGWIVTKTQTTLH